MIAVGFAVLWAGYTIGIWGYCLTQSYDVTFTQLLAQTWPGAQASITGPAPGQALGTVNNSVQVTNPAALSTEQGG